MERTSAWKYFPPLALSPVEGRFKSGSPCFLISGAKRLSRRSARRESERSFFIVTNVEYCRTRDRYQVLVAVEKAIARKTSVIAAKTATVLRNRSTAPFFSPSRYICTGR